MKTEAFAAVNVSVKYIAYIFRVPGRRRRQVPSTPRNPKTTQINIISVSCNNITDYFQTQVAPSSCTAFDRALKVVPTLQKKLRNRIYVSKLQFLPFWRNSEAVRRCLGKIFSLKGCWCELPRGRCNWHLVPLTTAEPISKFCLN